MSAPQKFAEGYVDVAERIAIFREKYPDGSLQPHNPDEPIKLITLGDRVFLQYVACAYRTPDDPRPGVGVAWEPFPGRTPYTRDSEAMVAETSAWGRAIVAVLAADTKRGIASAEEVRNAREREAARQNPADVARAQLLEFCRANGLDPQRVAADYATEHGHTLREASAESVQALLASLSESVKA